MRVSQSEFARLKGLSTSHIGREVRSGKIAMGEDGLIDFEEASRIWDESTSQKIDTAKDAEPVVGDLDKNIEMDFSFSDGEEEDQAVPELRLPKTYAEAKTQNEILKMKLNDLKLKQLNDRLYDRELVEKHILCFSRDLRNSWLNWSVRVAGQMSADLGIDAHKMGVILEKYVAENLEEQTSMVFSLQMGEDEQEETN
ncbi:hypothetical protein [Rickettsia endosymbiont of Cardiosporidium cionae]|uniref:hypothetical protein n=1 Tax=Rickettsia endosymbiont of Cardiosporidium cionae TaxID=2777155 RepID=UPI001892E306|nr:hypothetical protein [Rickettsia endosymbiont of Cardiosporidium cionae]KAF8818068.1 hypothetical protein IHI24_000867 [Rickettsia endosymbiont of Cardiosporidium cionae]